MAPPPASIPLYNQCSVVYQKVLYVFSADAFQSLPLGAGGTWKILPNGVPASDASCVLSHGMGDQDALYVVGGKTALGTDHTGFQRYIFSSGKWETLPLDPLVMQNRTGHGATFMLDTKSILTFAGSQNDEGQISSDSFSISIEPPYHATAFSSNGAPPLGNPMLLPWDPSQALLIGLSSGDLISGMLSPSKGWSAIDLKITGSSLKGNQYGAALFIGKDQSRILNVFDMSVSPNLVTSREAPPAVNHKWKRSAAPADGIVYDNTGAPVDIRSGFSQAQSDDGTVVFVGGSSQSSIALFDMSKNGWINSSNFFSKDAQSASSSSSSSTVSSSSSSLTSSSSKTTSSSSSSTSSSSTTSRISPSSTSSSHSSSTAALSSPSSSSSPDSSSTGSPNLSNLFGGIFGGLLALALLVLIILWFLRGARRRGSKNTAVQEQRLRHLTYEEKRPGSSSSSPGTPRSAGAVFPHRQQSSADSATSMTYLTGERAGQKKTSMLANVFRNSLGASHQASPWQSVTKMERVKPISRPALNTHPAVEDRNVLDPTSEVPVRRHRSSGWGRYFSESLPEGQQSTSTKSEPHILGGSLGAARNESDERRSQDSDLHSLAEIPPLSAHLQDYPGHPGIARVNSGYAQERDSSTFGVAITTPMSGQIAHISEAEDESNPFDDPGSARRDPDETRASVGGSSVWTNDTRHQSQNTGLVPPSYGSGAVERRPSTQQSPVSWLDLGRPR